MALNWLVVSDPPHRPVDQVGAAELLGLVPAEVGMKANFRAPEIWLAFPDEKQATDAAALLGETGINAAVLDGHVLSSIPGPAPVSSFEFGDSGFIARFQESELEFSYDAPTLAVFCKPPPGFRPSSSSAQSAPRPSFGRASTLDLVDGVTGAGRGRGQLDAAEALELMTNLDLYTRTEAELTRISIGRDLADFSGLGDLMRPSGDANMAVCLSECERHFNRLTVDMRLENVRPRQRPQVGGAAREHEARRLLSFGMMSLRQLLGSIAPDLGNLTQYELGSRLAWLLDRGAVGG